jgi:hypothetical protein
MNSKEASAADDQLIKLSDLIKNIELNLKKCTKKYKGKNEIEELYANLTVSLSKIHFRNYSHTYTHSFII